MPHILVSHSGKFSPFSSGGSGFPRMSELLKRVIVEQLATPEDGANLCDDDIAVSYQEVGSSDVQSHDVVVMVTANYFPTRELKKEERVAAISSELHESGAVPKGCSLGVWLLLPVAAWAESPAEK